MNDNILDPILYKKARRIADNVYKKHSAYKSMYIQNIYKKLGGRYKGSKKNSSKQGVSRWNKEQWIQVIPYLKYGKMIPCGSANKSAKVCRPLVRVSKDTPITLGELLKIHSKKDLLKLSNKKLKDMKGRVFWKTMKFYSSSV